MFNVYIVLRSLLRALLIDNSYKDTSIFIFRVWVFADYMTIPYNQVFFSSQNWLLRSGHPRWPWTIVCSLLSTSNLLPRMPLATKGCEAFFPNGYTNIYPLRIRLRISSMSSHVNQLLAGQKMANLYIVGSVVAWTAGCILVAITSALYDSPYRSNQ